MNKKGVSKIIVVILLILVVLAIIISLILFLKDFLKKEGEISKAKTELFTLDADIEDVNLSESNIVKLRISRGTGKVILKNITRTQPKADIVFLIHKNNYDRRN